ncbi:hypothetical protein PUN28_008394 [Cardiocondyla obscurior]|uniref:Uncharacterized protein n=1 Tax=Cardiocondyla obscurior TaxID=286306 RepID=A0AAW2G3T4_9HYME
MCNIRRKRTRTATAELNWTYRRLAKDGTRLAVCLYVERYKSFNLPPHARAGRSAAQRNVKSMKRNETRSRRELHRKILIEI